MGLLMLLIEEVDSIHSTGLVWAVVIQVDDGISP